MRKKNDRWRKTNGASCLYKYGVNRLGIVLEEENKRYINTSYIENNIDILGGHIPLGAGDALKRKDGTLEKVRYFTFFRDAIEKYVSGKIFSNRHNGYTQETLVQKIKENVNEEMKKGRYSFNYASYMITPFQRELNISKISKVKLIMDNILQYNVVIGMVDRMSESLQLLHHLIDSKKGIISLFRYFGMKENTKDGQQKKIQLNKSKISTLSVVQQLKNDEAFYQTFLEYVKYDQMVAEFARKVHFIQCEAYTKNILRLNSAR